jgi:Uma2 family endonuclease
MSIAATEKLMTADELLAMSEFRGELVKGRLVEMAPASWKHGQCGIRAAVIISKYVTEHKLGVVVAAETGFLLSRKPDSVRAPDVGFISADRVAKASESGFFDGPPDLAVEILSPNDKVFDVEEKIAEYIEAGCKLVWIINPKARTITSHRRGNQTRIYTEQDTLDGAEVLPGFSTPVSEFMV